MWVRNLHLAEIATHDDSAIGITYFLFWVLFNKVNCLNFNMANFIILYIMAQLIITNLFKSIKGDPISRFNALIQFKPQMFQL